MNFIAVFLPFLLLYRLTTNQIFSFDAVTNAIACETNEPVRWFHANHPLYPFLGVLWYRMERMFGYSGLSIYSLARFNSFLTAAGLGIFATIIGNKCGRAAGLASAYFTGMTYAVWNYAVDGRAIGASVFFSIAVIAYMFRIADKENSTSRDWILLAILSTLTTLMHGIAIFHAGPVAYFLWRKEKKPIPVLIYLTVIFLSLATIYAVIFIWIIKPFTHGPFLNWAIGYAGHEGSANAMRSEFWVNGWSQFFHGLMEGWTNAYAAHSPSGMFRWVPRVFSCALFAGLMALFIRVRHAKIPFKDLQIALISWGAIVGIFLLFWSPGQEGFRLHMIIPWFAAAALLIPWNRFSVRLIGLSAAGLFYWNFIFAFYPASFIQNNTGYQVLNAIDAHMNRGDVVLAGQSAPIPGIEVLLPYFFPQLSGGTVEGRLMAFREKNLEPLYLNLLNKHAHGSQLFFADDLFDPKVQQAIEASRGLDKGAMGSFVGHFHPVEFFVLPNNRQLFRVEPGK